MTLRHLKGARLIALLALTASSSASAAGERSLRLADGLLDKEGVCTVYMHTQRGALNDLAASWDAARREQAGQALYAELSPLLSDICARSWASARVRLADAIEAEMPASDRAVVYSFLSSSVGEKFIAGARADAIARIDPAHAAPIPSLSPAEKELALSTFASAAWSKYKLLHARARTLFGEAQAKESRPYEARMRAGMEAVKARFGR